jgi:hypothetical protein
MVGGEVEGAALVDSADSRTHAKVKKGTNRRKYKGVLASCPPAVLPGLGLACSTGWLGEALWMTQPSFRFFQSSTPCSTSRHDHIRTYVDFLQSDL